MVAGSNKLREVSGLHWSLLSLEFRDILYDYFQLSNLAIIPRQQKNILFDVLLPKGKAVVSTSSSFYSYYIEQVGLQGVIIKQFYFCLPLLLYSMELISLFLMDDHDFYGHLQVMKGLVISN